MGQFKASTSFEKAEEQHRTLVLYNHCEWLMCLLRVREFRKIDPKLIDLKNERAAFLLRDSILCENTHFPYSSLKNMFSCE